MPKKKKKIVLKGLIFIGGCDHMGLVKRLVGVIPRRSACWRRHRRGGGRSVCVSKLNSVCVTYAGCLVTEI